MAAIDLEEGYCTTFHPDRAVNDPARVESSISGPVTR